MCPSVKIDVGKPVSEGAGVEFDNRKSWLAAHYQRFLDIRQLQVFRLDTLHIKEMLNT